MKMIVVWVTRRTVAQYLRKVRVPWRASQQPLEELSWIPYTPTTRGSLKYFNTSIQIVGKTDRQTDNQKHRQTHTQTHTQTHRQTDKHAESWADRQTDRRIDTQTHRQIDTQTHRHTDR